MIKLKKGRRKKKEEQERREEEKEKLRFERFVKKGIGFPILLGFLYILNCLVFVVCWVLQMRNKLVYGEVGLVRGDVVKISSNPK